MAVDWATVHRMLTDPKAPRRDAQGRNVYEVWADLVLANPPLEYARVAAEILPKETPNEGASNTTLSIQQLYLTAVQQANRVDPKLIEALPSSPTEDDAW